MCEEFELEWALIKYWKTLEKEIGAVAVEKLTSSKETYTPGSMA